MRPFRPASLSLADPAVVATLTVIPPKPTLATEDRLRTENRNLRAMVTALLDELVSRDLVQARNYAEHPRTVEQLAAIGTAAHNRYARIALNAVPAKEKQ